MGKKVFIDFILWETEMPPKEITKQVGVVPDAELLKGERDAERILPRQNLWSLRSTLSSDDISEQWKELSSKLNPAKDTLKDIAKNGIAKVTIVVTTQGYIPNITIPFGMLEFMGYIDGVIDVDHLQ